MTTAKTASNDNQPKACAIRFSVEPRLIPAAKAARRLHLAPCQFEDKRGALLAHGFPAPCPVTGHFDLVAIDSWLDRMSGIEGNKPAETAMPDAEFERRLASIG